MKGFQKLRNRKNIRFFVLLLFVVMSVSTVVYVYLKEFPLYYNRVNSTRWWLINKTLDKTYDLTDSLVTKLFIGDSRPNAGIDFTAINNSWSFCAGGSTPIENYYFLRKYFNNYSVPDTVYVSISPRFLVNTFAFWDLAVRNDFFTKDEFREILSHLGSGDTRTLGRNIRFRYFLRKMKFIKYYQEDVRNNFIFMGKKRNDDFIRYVMLHKGSRLHPHLRDSCSEFNFETGMEYFKPADIMVTYFDSIFSICKSNGVFCVFFAMPMNESSFGSLSFQFKSDYKEYMQRFSFLYPDFRISDSLYFYPDIFFGDASHLNEKGKVFFTKNTLPVFISR